MSTFDIKIIAILTMVIDHIGLFFFPQEILFRIVGRLSFPLFAWLIANGAYHTHDIKKYALRLILFAGLSQIPFSLANRDINPTFNSLNVLFTLFLGLMAIICIKSTKKKSIQIGGVILMSIVAQIANTDYGYTGVLCIVMFFLFFKQKTYLIITQMILLFLLPIVLTIVQQKTHLPIYSFIESPLEAFALFSLIVIMKYNQQQGPKTKYLFYIFYPIQYVIICLIQIIK